jgi:ribose transport system ATP-binding protein
VVIASPTDAVRANIGISLVPEDRKTEALFLKLPGTENASIPVIDRFSNFGFIDLKKEREAVSAVFQRVDVQDRALWTRVGAFSGGNQQKIAIAKWLLAQSRVLLLYDPTRGIDVGTKAEIFQLLRKLADAGAALLFYSTDYDELVGCCDRVLVFYDGAIGRVLAGAEITERALVGSALNLGSPQAAAGTPSMAGAGAGR